MADTKQTKTIGEHYVAAELARRGWAPALTRDGLERTDILAVRVDGESRTLAEVQVKAARSAKAHDANWPLGTKSQSPSLHDREFFVLVAVPHAPAEQPSYFVVPRIHLAASAWIAHMDWLTDPTVEKGRRNAPVDRSRVHAGVFGGYANRWDLLEVGQAAAPVLLPSRYRELAMSPRVGLPPGHEWHHRLPEW